MQDATARIHSRVLQNMKMIAEGGTLPPYPPPATPAPAAPKAN